MSIRSYVYLFFKVSPKARKLLWVTWSLSQKHQVCITSEATFSESRENHIFWLRPKCSAWADKKDVEGLPTMKKKNQRTDRPSDIIFSTDSTSQVNKRYIVLFWSTETERYICNNTKWILRTGLQQSLLLGYFRTRVLYTRRSKFFEPKL